MENVPSSIPAGEPPPSSSLAGRLLNVFAAPGDVFDELKTADSSVANWLVPVLIVMLVTITSFAVTLSQPAIKQQVVEMQEKAIDQQVAAGKIKPDQAKAFKEQMAALPPWVMQLFGIVQGVVAGFCGTFWWALVLWLLGKLALHNQDRPQGPMGDHEECRVLRTLGQGEELPGQLYGLLRFRPHGVKVPDPPQG